MPSALIPSDCFHPMDLSACNTFPFGWLCRLLYWSQCHLAPFWVCLSSAYVGITLPLLHWASAKSFGCWRVLTFSRNTLEGHRELSVFKNPVSELSSRSSEWMCHAYVM